MKGDFSRNSFNKEKNYNRVLTQQGRVSLDSDANELNDILTHLRRTTTVDVIGSCCAPVNASGFEIRYPEENYEDLLISTGRIYVGGLLCENHPTSTIPVIFPAGSTDQVQIEELKIDGVQLSEDQWVAIKTKENNKGIVTQITDINANILTVSKIISSLHTGTSPRLQLMIPYSQQTNYPNPPPINSVFPEVLCVLKNQDGRLEVFARGTDKALWHIWQTAPNDGWSGWASMGGQVDRIAVGRNKDGRLEVFARSTDKKVWHIWQTTPNNGWSSWTKLRDQQADRLVIGQNKDGRLELFVRGVDKKVWHIWQIAPNNGWSNWAKLRDQQVDLLTVGNNNDGRLEVFARGDDKKVWHIWQTAPNNGWSNWARLGNRQIDLLSVDQNEDGRLEVFVRGLDKKVWHIWQTAPNDGWSRWASRDGQIYAKGKTDLIYLDVWDRMISTIEDPELQEVALGGPDTTTRVQTVAQVKILEDVGSVDCVDFIPEWEEILKPSGGRLTTFTVPGTEPDDPCHLGDEGGYKGLENRLYRVEIHQDGDPGTATFKWSRDNGSVAYPISEFIPDETDPTKVFKVKLSQLGRDKILKIKKNDWLEISGDETELDVDNAGTMVQVTDVDEAQRILTFSVDIAIHKHEAQTKVRRWDTGEETQTPPIATSSSPIKLENGIQIQFSGSNFKVRDYWIFEARTATGKIKELNAEPPQGINHHYCKLAVVNWRGDNDVVVNDCRNEFQTLCELSKIKTKAKGVGCCTVTVGKDGDFDNIQDAVNALGAGAGTVCLLPGVYPIYEPIMVSGMDITIKGCGGKSLILNLSDSMNNGIVFKIQNSWEISIENLWAVTVEGDRALLSNKSHFVHLKDCLFMAFGTSDIPGAIVFQGTSLVSEVIDCLIAGIVGIRYEPDLQSKTNMHVGVRVEKNIIFALQSAVLQTNQAVFLGSNIKDNLLLGFAINSLMKAFFPVNYLTFINEKKMFDRTTINKASGVNREKTGVESTTATNITPVYFLANHLKTEASAVRVMTEIPDAMQIVTSSPVIDLNSGGIDINILNNTILGQSGIEAKILMESLIDDNLIIASLYGVLLEDYEGLCILGNLVYAKEYGLYSHGRMALNLNAENNRLLSSKKGIIFHVEKKDGFNLLMNVQINNNFITATESGIDINNPGLIVTDFTAVDNSITGCSLFGIILRGFDENQFLQQDVASYQRVIQRNSVQVKGVGIAVKVADAKILDNDLTIKSENEDPQAFTYGIMIFAENCTVSNNTVQGVVDFNTNSFSKGGILINVPPSHQREPRSKKVIIRDNRIYGGVGNGIEIASDLDDLVIDGNLITQMGINGIAVGNSVQRNNMLDITNNKITQCHKWVGIIEAATWWKYGGIVLRSGSKIQISGNEICENGRQIKYPNIYVCGIHAEKIQGIIISDNQLINNGPQNPDYSGDDAVIHIPADPAQGNADVKIVNNIVQGSTMPALFLGGQFQFIYTPTAILYKGIDQNTVITGNHFVTLLEEIAVNLQSCQCIFSNNFVERAGNSGAPAVSLGFGWYVTAISNVTSADIIGFGLYQVIDHNVVF